MQIEGSKFIVTGGASGMGRCFTLLLAELGADVAFCDVNPEGIAAVEAEGAELSGRVVGFQADVSSEESMKDLIKNAADTLGGLNGIINNAGIIRDGLLAKKDRKTGDVRTLSMSKWQKVIDVNLTGVFLGSREFADWHINNGGTDGVIISISSISRHGNQGQSNYSAAKSGIVAMTTLWGAELARYGIRTGAIAPGFTMTPILEGMPPEMLDHLKKPVPLRRIGRPEEVFLAVKFIIECGYFTGRCIDVDGGLRLA